MSDEVLIQTIRDALQEEVEGMQPPPGLLERVPTPRRIRPLPSLGWLVPVLAVGVAAVVAVVAITSLGHRAPAARPNGSAVPPAARGLVATLSILRRPQTAADRLPASAARDVPGLPGHARLVPGLSRFVGFVHDRVVNARLYLIVETSPGYLAHATGGEDVAALYAIGQLGHGYVAGVGDTFTTNLALTGPDSSGGVQGRWASIVPDGVARVQLAFAVESGGSSRTVEMLIRPHDNIARARTPRDAALISAAWYGAHRRLISSVGSPTSPASQPDEFERAVKTSQREHLSAVLQRHFAVVRSRLDALPPIAIDDLRFASLIDPNPVDLNVLAARFVPHSGVWVIPGSQGLAVQVGASTLNARGGVESALDGSLFVVGAAGHGRKVIIGLAPDGNRTVTVLLRGGHSRSARVVDNVYSIVVPASARTLILRSASGRAVHLQMSFRG